MRPDKHKKEATRKYLATLRAKGKPLPSGKDKVQSQPQKPVKKGGNLPSNEWRFREDEDQAGSDSAEPILLSGDVDAIRSHYDKASAALLQQMKNSLADYKIDGKVLLLQDEKDWNNEAVSASQLGDLFALDLGALESALLSLPRHERLGCEEELFMSNQNADKLRQGKDAEVGELFLTRPSDSIFSTDQTVPQFRQEEISIDHSGHQEPVTSIAKPENLEEWLDDFLG